LDQSHATAQEIIVQGQKQENVFSVADFDTEASNGPNVQFIATSQNANKTDWDLGD
jgi:PKD repeat protein